MRFGACCCVMGIWKNGWLRRSESTAPDVQDFWERELTPEEEEKLIEEAAKVILSRRLETPAIMAIEVHKPLASIGGQTMVALAPFIAPFIGFDRLNQWSQFMVKPGAIDRLIQRLEDGARATTESTK